MATDIKAIISAVDQTGPAFRSAQQNVADFASQARRAAGLLAGVFGAFSVAGIVASLKSITDEMDRVGKSAQKIGTTTEALSALEYAASLSDISVESLQTSLAKLARNLDEAQSGSGAAADAFARLKIDPAQFSDPSDALKAIAEKFAALPDGVSKTALAMQLFGKSGADLIPLLNAGAGGIADMENEARRLGRTFSSDAAKSAEEFNDNITRLQAGMKGFMIEALGPIIPMLVEFTERLTVMSTLIRDGGLFNTLVNTAGARNFEDVLKRVRREILLTEQAIAGKKERGLDPSAFEEKLRGLNSMLQVLIANRVQAIQQPPGGFKPFQPSTETVAPPVDKAAESARKAAARAAAAEARREAAALVKAQQELEKNRLEAEAQGLADGIDARKQLLDQRRRAELVDEATFIRAKAMLEEEGLRNELAALQAQQARLRAASTDSRAKGSERTQALADLALVEARIQSAADKILNLNQAATAELAALGVAKLKAQAEFIDGLEQEAFLSGLNNDERETALLLLEAEKLGIEDVNRLLELQSQIRANVNAKKAAEELKREQDDLYKSVQDGVQRAFADGLNSIATGQGGFRAALKNIADTIRNAMSNVIAGGLTEQFLGLLGGKQGVLNIAATFGLGGKKDGSTAANALYVRDVGVAGAAGSGNAAAGALGEVAGIGEGLFSSLGDMLSNLFNGIKTSLSGLVSSIGSALSSLFSSSGGGSGGGSSNAGSWVSLIASLFGYADGGWTGPGSKYQPAGIVHADEFVFDKAATNRIGVDVLENLRRVASGRIVSSRPRLGYAEGGLVNLPGAAAPVVNSNTRVINYFDMDSAMSDYLGTRSGERAVLNIIQRNPRAAGA